MKLASTHLFGVVCFIALIEHIYSQCEEVNCNFGTCNEENGQSTCVCNTGYVGEYCNVNSNGVFCENVSEYGYEWPVTNAGDVAMVKCNSSGSTNFQGVINRLCDVNGMWQGLDWNKCTNPMFTGVRQELTRLYREIPGMISVSEVQMLASMLMEATAPPSDSKGAFITPSDLKLAVECLQFLQLSISQKNGSEKIQTINGTASQWFRSCSNVIDRRNSPSYMATGVNALALINNIIDSLDIMTGEYGMFSIKEQKMEYPNLKIVGGPVQTISQGETVAFPITISFSGGENVRFDSRNLETLMRQIRTNTVHIGMTVSNGLSDIIEVTLNSTQTRNKIPISKFITVRAGGQQGRIELSNPINITFNLSREDSQYSDSSRYTQTCGYWNSSIGTLSGDGLDLVVRNPAINKFVCSSLHLTSFSVVIQPNPSDGGKELAVSIVTYILSIVSILALLISIVIYLLLGKELFKKDLYMVHFNYAIALTASSALFIFGVQTARNNAIACSIIAGIIHYAFLSVFTWSLCEAILVVYMLFVLFAPRKIYPYLMLVGWGLPFPVLIITVGVRWYNYGVVGQYCWLSTENGVIWSFIGPALIVVFINGILLVISIARIVVVLDIRTRQMTRVKQAKAAAIGTLILVPFLGIPCLVAVPNVFFSISLFQWIFILLNTPQGLIFFLLYVLYNRKLLRKVFCRKRDIQSPRHTQRQRGSDYSPQRSTMFKKQFSQSLELKATGQEVKEREINLGFDNVDN